jgi:hypothetical protein
MKKVIALSRLINTTKVAIHIGAKKAMRVGVFNHVELYINEGEEVNKEYIDQHVNCDLDEEGWDVVFLEVWNNKFRRSFSKKTNTWDALKWMGKCSQKRKDMEQEEV